MIPTIASSGASFKGAAAYYLHDKDAKTRERVAWTHTENLLTDSPHRAWKIMAWTAMNQAILKEAAGTKATGRKLEKPVFPFSVAWHPEQNPDKAHMLATAKAAVASLGLAEYQALYVSHSDEPQRHVHVIVNRVHPVTGKAATLSRSKEKLAAWALEYEREHGKIYCKTREANARRREEGQPGREGDAIIREAWRQSDNGRSFQAGLKGSGYTLAQGNRRLVVIDRWGKAHNPVRHLENVRAKEFQARLQDLDLNALPKAATVQKEIRQEQRHQYHASRRYDRRSAEYLNKNQDRQNDERAALGQRYETMLDDKKRKLWEYYKQGEVTKEIAALRERIRHGGVVRRLTGATAKDRRTLEAKKALLANIKERTVESLNGIATERELAKADLAARHARENEYARRYLSERKPNFYLEEKVIERSQQQSRHPERQREMDNRLQREH